MARLTAMNQHASTARPALPRPGSLAPALSVAARSPRRLWRRPAARPAMTQSQELLAELQAMDEAALVDWAAANRGALTLDLLQLVAQAQAAAAEEEERERLWALGSKLMAVREGLVPVASEELRAAALKACQPSTSARSGGDASSSGEAAALQVVQQQQQQQLPLVPAQEQQGPQQQPALSFLVRRTAQLGLSAEGLTLLQQQAAALELVVGDSKARSLTEVIGRKQLSPEEQLGGVFEADAAARILQLLVSLPDREERAALLPEAFTPAEEPAAGAGAAAAAAACAGSQCIDSAEDEELLSTTPLALLQAIDLQLSRLSQPVPQGAAGLLAGATFSDVPPAELEQRLQQLREDVAAYWERATDLGNTSGEEW